MRELVVGLDGGGTQTRVLVTDRAGDVVGSGLSGPCSMAAVTPPEALKAALAAIDDALIQAGASRADVAALCAGVAGFSSSNHREQFTRSLQAAFPSALIAVEPDYVTALAGGTGGVPGVLVIAGTGSVAYGENSAGASHKTGAYGYLIDDGGSGYGVGRAALAAVMQAADGTGPETALTGRVLDSLALSSVSDIVPGVYGGALSRVAIASLSHVVAEAAGDADPVARSILMRAGGTLAHLVHGVTAQLFSDASNPFPVVQVGGLWSAGDALTDVFTRSLRRFAPAAVITAPKQTPVEGAVQKALRLLDPNEKSSLPS